MQPLNNFVKIRIPFFAVYKYIIKVKFLPEFGFPNLASLVAH